MITYLEWKESVCSDTAVVWQNTGSELKRIQKPIQRRTWSGQLGLITMHIIERDMDYLARVCGSDTNWLDSWFNMRRNDREVNKDFIAPDLEGAKRGALEYAFGFLKRDLVIVCGELGVPVP